MKDRIIGVCLTEAHSQLNTGFLIHLYRFVSERSFSLLVFNYPENYNSASIPLGEDQEVAPFIDYSRLSALIILSDYFHDRRTVSGIIREATENKVPVLSIGNIWKDCCSIVNDYYLSYKELLNHVIRVHGAKDTFFISGFPDEDNSALRLQCYCEVLEENGLPFLEENVAYGDFWTDRARSIAEELIRSREKLPDAIFCANDIMAVAVCDVLLENGYSIPEDVIVTGFDCLPIAEIQRPRLATLDADPEGLADLAVSTIMRILAGERVEPILHHAYLPRFADSCGCECAYPVPYDLYSMYRQKELLVSHENSLYRSVEQFLQLTDINQIFSALSGILLPDSAICLNPGILNSPMDSSVGSSENQTYVISAGQVPEDGLPYRLAPTDQMVPDELLSEGCFCLINMIRSEKDAYGSYVVRTDNIEETAQLIKRVSDMLNLVFSITVSRIRQKRLLANIENSVYIDPMTSLSNLKGLSRWFSRYAEAESSRDSALVLSVHTLDRYAWISEAFGIEETESVLAQVIQMLRAAYPDPLIIARIAEDQFAMYHRADDRSSADAMIAAAGEKLEALAEEFNRSTAKPWSIALSSGCTVLDRDWSQASCENMISVALGEIYLNRLRAGKYEQTDSISNEANMYNAFSLMMQKNLLRYFFQPIVDAKTGSIYAYEALMRSDDLIGMTPLEILSVAGQNNRLYDVERETLFGIMEKYTKNYQAFRGSKLFINTIPGHFLNEQDCETLVERFEDYLDCFVFELTEQDSISDDELDRVKRLCKQGGQAQIAIDDYGTGHSNIVNLLRYSPQVIKIDRYLISGIQDDPNKQMFVKNTIAFAHQNGIKALAEGIETSEELRTVIEFGIDLIQGFYTARPSENPVTAISDRVRGEIIEENVRQSKYDSAMLVYSAHDGEILNLFELAIQKYTFINILGGTVTIVGEKSHTVDLVIRFPDNTDSTLILDNVNIKGATETTVQLGRNSTVTLILRGKNTLNKEGILVPPTSTLIVRGDGDLLINNNRNYAVGIGANYNNPFGTILLDLDGSLTMNSTGDKVVGIGGGRGEGDGIRFINGSYRINARGINVVCVGSTGGNAVIDIGNVSLVTQAQGNDAVSLGSLAGRTVITSSGQLDLVTDGERSTGIGSLTGTGEITLNGGRVNSAVHCDIGTCIGTLSGETEITVRNTSVRVLGEGTRAVGFGSLTGAGNIRIKSGLISGSMASADGMILGNEQTRMTVTGGNFLLDSVGDLTPVGPTGKPLSPYYPHSDHYEQTFRDGSTSWTYVADRSPDDVLCVFIPQ